MVRPRAIALTAFALLMTVSGCSTTGGGAPGDQVQSAGCPETLPDRAPTDVDDGSGRQLVPTTPDPVRLTLCVYGLTPVVERDSAPGTPVQPPPVEQTWDGADADAAVTELNALPAFLDAEDHVCNAAMWPGYLLLVGHADGTATALTVDRSCALVSDGEGAVRLGLPHVVASNP